MKTWYERKRNRAWWHDYSSPGVYFITICTRNREHYFGEISNKKMQISEIGKIACQCWEKMPEISLDIELDYYGVMPNHLHGIIIITNKTGNRRDGSLQPGDEDWENRRLQRLPKVMGSYKSVVTRMANDIPWDLFFGWQRSYYDHIIRNEKSLNIIRRYILNNPANWSEDLENPGYISGMSKEERESRSDDHYNNLFKYD